MKKKRSKLQWLACLLVAAVMMTAGAPTILAHAMDDSAAGETPSTEVDLLDEDKGGQYGNRSALGIVAGTDSKYKVGSYQNIKGAEGMDAHHVGQKAQMKNLVENYQADTAPAINVPKVGHTIGGPNGIVSRDMTGIDNPRQLLARDLFELKRVYPDIPNSAYKELINMNINMYPEMREK